MSIKFTNTAEARLVLNQALANPEVVVSVYKIGAILGRESDLNAVLEKECDVLSRGRELPVYRLVGHDLTIMLRRNRVSFMNSEGDCYTRSIRHFLFRITSKAEFNTNQPIAEEAEDLVLVDTND